MKTQDIQKAPINENILLIWENGIIENGTITPEHKHTLFDDAKHETEPQKWAPIPPESTHQNINEAPSNTEILVYWKSLNHWELCKITNGNIQHKDGINMVSSKPNAYVPLDYDENKKAPNMLLEIEVTGSIHQRIHIYKDSGLTLEEVSNKIVSGEIITTIGHGPNNGRIYHICEKEFQEIGFVCEQEALDDMEFMNIRVLNPNE